jgi:hypothetical protein
VPFDQLVIFSTNLEPRELVDEAFLRRIPFKIEIGDPSEDEFHQLFELYSRSFGCEYRRDVVEGLLDRPFRPTRRRLRRCQPRDLLLQIRSYCNYAHRTMEMLPEYFDRAVKTYFATVLGEEA